MGKIGMRTLRRNQTVFEYLAPDRLTSDLDEFGRHTGDMYPVHSEPVTYKGNISMPSGQTNNEFFGTDIRYTHVLVMKDPEVDIVEGGVIRWKGNLYDIKAVRPSINTFSAALRRKTANNAESEVEG